MRSINRVIAVVAGGSLALAAARAPAPPGATLEEAAMLQSVVWVPPVYPPQAVDKKLEGTVRVRFIVDETGAVIRARVLHSTDKVFEGAALQAVRQWRFAPVVEDGSKIAKCVDAMLPFELADLHQRSKLSRLETRVVRALVFPG